ncbi:MAG: pyridoxal-phosphate dependent enzyme [Desulfobacteraceae bacterium]|jgi:threonine synthase
MKENRESSQDMSQLYTLIDGAVGDVDATVQDVDAQRRIAADISQPLSLRLEAFEDIIDSQVGDTSMVRTRNIEREKGLRQIFLKFEGGNPTGTQKDRIAFAQAMDALRRGFDTITVATCGNYGVAMAMACSLAGLRSLIFIPDNYHTKRIVEMKRLGAEIHRISGDYEAAVEKARSYAEKNECYDANPGGDNTVLQLQAYGNIAYEIYDELRDAPAVVAVPVSNGTTLAGLYRGFLSLYRRGKTSHMPRIVAGSSFGKNPIVRSFLLGEKNCRDLSPERIRETRVNEPLVNWHAIDGEHALKAIKATKGWAANASDKAMRQYARLLCEKEGLQVLPASTAGLIALMEQHRKKALDGDRYVVLLTGRKS